jgi:hypothetical protein
MMGIVTIPEGSAVVFKRQLSGLNSDGAPCEICGNKMAAHDWVIMSEHGFVVVGCSFKMEPFNEKKEKPWLT